MLFLFLCYAFIQIGLYMVQLGAKTLESKAPKIIKLTLIQLLILLVVYAQFWSLTTIFPVTIVIALLCSLLIGNILYELIVQFTNLSLPQKKEKINFLTAFQAFQRGIESPKYYLITILSGILLFISWIIALFVFWFNPLNSSDTTIIWLSMCIFIIPHISGTIGSFVILIPTVTSRKIDDDMRNSHLIRNFSLVIYMTIYFIFPISLFYQQYDGGIWLPPYWILISIPLFLFMITAVIPFFIGMNRYRIYMSEILNWRKKWLDDFYSTLLIPQIYQREQQKNEMINTLDLEINKYWKQNQTLLDQLEYYKNHSAEIVDEKTKIVLKALSENFNKLKEWDIELSHMYKLDDIQKNIEEVEKQGNDWVLDIDILPNRGSDCFSHHGIAREISAILEYKLELPEARL
ncbi:MAG: hypothetical protein ACC656_10840, partial [Candidatus Heimdallarchaeota archaeon]